MKRTKLFCLVFFILNISTVVWAQSQVSGVVIDEAQSPLLGVTVVIKGTTNGQVTDLDGRFNPNKSLGI